MIAFNLLRALAIMGILVLSVLILVYGKPFLMPLTFAALLAMLVLPLARWCERKGLSRGWSSLIPLLALLLTMALVGLFIGWQLSSLSENVSRMEQKLTEKYRQVQAFISKKAGIPPQKQQQMIQQQRQQSPGKAAELISRVLTGAGSVLASCLLVLVYIFLMLYFRRRLRRFLLRIVPGGEKGTALEILGNVQQVSQKYLGGLAMMIGALWVMYSIGFSLVGLENALFFAVLCGLLEIIPFVGNLAGTMLTLGFSLVQGGSTDMVIGILATYAVVQFIQSYLLEPLVVGAEVQLNPLFTIVGLIAGEQLWGIPGMVLAIPLLGIFKIVCDNVEVLKPYGYLLGEEQQESSARKKIKEWLARFKKKK